MEKVKGKKRAMDKSVLFEIALDILVKSGRIKKLKCGRYVLAKP